VAFSPSEPAFAAEIGFYESSALAFYASASSPRQVDHVVCCHDLEFSADGVGMYTTTSSYGGDATQEIVFYERYGAEPVVLLTTEEGVSSPDISPAGDRLLYVHDETIEIMSLPSRARTPIVAGRDPAWRPGQAAAGVTEPGKNPGETTTTQGQADAPTTDAAKTDTGTAATRGPDEIIIIPPASRSRQSGSGAAGLVVMVMVLGLFAWGVYMARK
jgi:hypothetical protein